MRYGELFAGYGGIGLALEAVFPDARPAWFVEFDQAPSKVLAHHWPDVPNHGDITTVDWASVEPVDVLTGGFPCQDLSHAGKRLGLRPGTRSGLWEHMAYAISQLRPSLVVIENVRGLLSAGAHSDLEPCPWCVGGAGDGEPALRALGAVLGDLAELGYDARWVGVRAADAGAPHGRFRVFIVAHPADADLPGLEGRPPVGRGADQRPAGPGGVGTGLVGVGPQAPQPVTLDAGVGTEVTGVGVDQGVDGGESPSFGGHGSTMPVLAANLSSPLWDLPHIAFGPYAAAIARWEAVLGRPAPSPTQPGKDGRPRLSPLFVEWLMGLPAGWVTDPAIGLTRAQALRCLGNGVVPQQARLALSLLLGLPATGAGQAGALLPTPTTDDAGNAAGRPSGAFQSLARVLLPTPQAHDAVGGKTPEQVADMRARTGAGVSNLNEVVEGLLGGVDA